MKGARLKIHPGSLVLLISSPARAMIAESDVTTDPGLRRLGSRLLRQGALYDRLARAPRTEEAIHRLRVLTRRMRAACMLARPNPPPPSPPRPAPRPSWARAARG